MFKSVTRMPELEAWAATSPRLVGISGLTVRVFIAGGKLTPSVVKQA